MATVFRPFFGRVLSVGVWVLCSVGLVLTARHGVDQLVDVLPWLGLTAGGVWALFWNPRVSIDDGGVHLVNVLRTIDLPWPAIQLVDTKWALTLVTAYGKFTAWAAPAPGSMGSARRMTRSDRKVQPASALGPGETIRPGDLPDTPSGSAALVIRRRWEELRDAGYLEDPRLEFAAAPVRWHWFTIVGGAVLIIGCLATILI